MYAIKINLISPPVPGKFPGSDFKFPCYKVFEPDERHSKRRRRSRKKRKKGGGGRRQETEKRRRR